MPAPWQPLKTALLLAALLSLSLRAPAGELVMASSSSSPPYIIPNQDSGIAVELIRAAFAPAGLDVRFIYAPNIRVEHELESRKVDGVYTVPNEPGRNYFLSTPVLHYRNIAVTLASRSLHINEIADLQGLRVATFQNATRYLGPAFSAAVANSTDYLEVSNQQSQVSMLFNGRVDVIVLEERIFEYFRSRLPPPANATPVQIHPLFPAAPRHAGFATAALRDLFNQGLRALRESGEYDAIIAGYQR